jgi:drug/metabolite transporter (DMT)-like permease
MGILLLLLTIAGFSGMQLCVGVGGRRGRAPLHLTWCLMAASMAASMAWLGVSAARQGSMPPISPHTLLGGVVCGLFGSTAFLCLTGAMRIGHYALTTAVTPLSAAAPVLASWLLWSEPVTARGLISLAILFTGLVMISLRGRRYDHSATGATFGWLGLVLLSILLNSLGATSQAVSVRNHPGQTVAFLAMTFLTATIALGLAVLAARRPPWAAAGYGSLAGAGCFVANISLMSSLVYLPEEIVFPLAMGGPVIVAAVLSRTFFHERLTGWGYAGIVLGVGGAILLCV